MTRHALTCPDKEESLREGLHSFAGGSSLPGSQFGATVVRRVSRAVFPGPDQSDRCGQTALQLLQKTISLGSSVDEAVLLCSKPPRQNPSFVARSRTRSSARSCCGGTAQSSASEPRLPKSLRSLAEATAAQARGFAAVLASAQGDVRTARASRDDRFHGGGVDGAFFGAVLLGIGLIKEPL